MKKWFSYIRNHHQDIFRIFLIFLAILLITSQYPQFGAFKYDFQEGKPWGYEDLTAPASFPIKKSDEELQKEREQVKEEVKPYYEWRPDVAERAEKDFIADLRDQLQNLTADNPSQIRRDSGLALNRGSSLLNDIYAQGLIRLNESHKPANPDFQFNLVQDNEVAQVQLDKFYTAPQATEHIHSTLDNMQGPVQQILTATLKRNLKPNVVFDSTTTNQMVREALSQISEYRGAVQKDEAIIRYGEIVTPEKYQKLVSLREYMESQYGERNRLMVAAGYFLVTALLLTIFGFFVFNFSADVFRSTRKILFILVLIVGMLLIVSWAAKAEIPSYYVLPFCIVPITLRTFFGTRLSLYAHLITVLLAGFFLPVGIEYITLNLVAGMVAIFTNIKVHYWSQFFISIGFILLTYVIGFMGIALIQEGNFMQLQWLDFGWLTINVFLTLLAYPIIPIFEKLFGYVSDITLMELGDLNKPLLKDLQIKAPGTFQHSLQVSNLAEAAASEIGANGLLVKVGSLYHDVGKMQNPVYFIENQSTKYNPHDNLPFDESAKVIIAHVKKGVDLAKKHNLPDILIDFIRTHHGTSRVEYFYRSYIKSFPESDVDENIFKYPGPLPYSKETAVVMMADTVEATARSMKEPTAEALDKLVDNLIISKVEQQQFIKSNITFKEIEEVKAIFKKMLKSIYHVRIEYPDK